MANAIDNTATIFNADSLTVVTAGIDLSGAYPHEITLSADNMTAYIMNRDSDNISILDINTGAEINTISLTGSQPSKAVIAPNGYLYVTYIGSAFVSKVDITATTPVEDSTIDITAANGGAIDVTPDGSSLYVGSNSDTLLCKIDIATATATEVATFPLDQIADIKIDSDGMAFIAPVYGTEIYRFDTATDTAGTNIGFTTSDLTATDLVLEDGKIFAAMNGTDTGGIVEVATDFDQTGYAFDNVDDGSYDVTLPFTFSFQETDYTTATISSNGVVGLDGEYSYEDGIDNILGFAPNNEDLDSGDIFNYSTRVYSDRVVFQWLTATYDDDSDVNDMVLNEVVLFSNGKARFDYLFSGPEAIINDDGFSYGVGDGSVALVDMRAQLGSPFDLKRVSYLWDPASPNVITEVPFIWEGTGIHFNPAIMTTAGGRVDGVAVTNRYIFMVVPYDYNNSLENEVVVYDRSTMLPLTSTVTVGNGVTAIVIFEQVQ